MDINNHADGCKALVKEGHENCLKCLKNENDALSDAISALKDFVEGNRHDCENISEILNGALKIKK